MKKYFKPMTKVVKVEEKETVLAGSGSDSVGMQISGQGPDDRGGIRETTSDDVHGGADFAKPFSPSFDDAE